MTTKDETTSQEEKMDIQQVIEELGISRTTLIRRVEAGAITPLPKPPYLKRRYKTMFRKEDVMRLKEMEVGH